MDIKKVRQEIPHYGSKIFLNSAGSSLPPYSVNEKIRNYLEQEEIHGGYHVAENQKSDLEAFYLETANLIGTGSRNIAFAHDATDAYAKALSSIDFNKGDLIITTDVDYGSNQIQFISLKKRFGIEISRIKTLENGELDIADFSEKINKRKPKLVAVTHVPTNSGLIQNVVAIGEICNQKGILFLVDACQSLGQLPVDVKKIKCDFLSSTGRKFLRGPRGTGFLYVSDNVIDSGMEPLFIDGRGAAWTGIEEYKHLESAKRFEMWECPFALKVGLAEAIRYVNFIGINNIYNYNQKLMATFRKNLENIPEIEVYDKGIYKANILTIRKKGKSLSEHEKVFKDNEIICDVSNKEWGIIDFAEKQVEWLIRLSPHYFNTLEEIHKVSNILNDL